MPPNDDRALAPTASANRPDRFRGFLRELSAIVESGIDEQRLLSQCADAVARLVKHDDWLPDEYRQPDVEKYRQYLLYCDPQERFCILSFVWGPAQSTPIHNHETWGVIGILSGSEVSQRFRLLGGQLVAEGAPSRLERGEVNTLSPQEGDIHRVENGRDDGPSVAIHVYGAEIGSLNRLTFTPDGQPKPFASRYANHLLPNFW